MLVGAAPGIAHAAPPVDPVDHYVGTDSFDTTDCGLNLHSEVSYSGMSFIKPAPGSQEAFLVHDRYRFTEEITLASDPDGPSVTTRGSGTFVETTATLLDPARPTIYQFTTVDAGTFRLHAADGGQLVTSNGVYKATNIQDTLGDKAPGSQLIEEVTGDFHGNESGEFCDAVTAELT
ncbi:hypothetical protein [Nocardioides aurantiacus]|uniref:hypothetical protein n=1 Tax=Nocardioides aurantiacus TaxID=86796 RepID=UPI0011CD5957|nr:hypothetical protein [Nocardioides aurantiacus]